MEIARDLDWTLLRTLLAVAEAGSLSGAARVLGQSQPTIGRHIRSAEDKLGQLLFQRHARGLRPTPFCETILPMARDMRSAVQRLSLQVAGTSQTATGRVRLTASVFVTVHILPDILSGLQRSHPQIDVDVIASDTTENLLFHEADIALRMYRPTQLDMVTRHLGDLQLGLYAAESYLARHGEPATAEDLRTHRMVGFDRNEQLLRGLRDMGFDVTRDWFATCTDNQVAYWNFVVAGCGIGVGQTVVADRTPGVRRILHDLAMPVLPVWLTAHPGLRHQPRIAAVWEALDRSIAPLLS
ncbi:LysR family transcriptional regulator [Roseibacterium sp. SDUM158016]|uniref:LysR family transcriptional regulator n=1 Tax=Roseicyclus sediminis TaxID=2980997 RepID=UPI0021D0875A|nr:LysR family transcriptional regulator [Roseibacterium sp. SDUM158016]MCU4651639.1 LysR family transcriptional regulator [Roseibacterium sp. SDUM158016]